MGFLKNSILLIVRYLNVQQKATSVYYILKDSKTTQPNLTRDSFRIFFQRYQENTVSGFNDV